MSSRTIPLEVRGLFAAMSAQGIEKQLMRGDNRGTAERTAGGLGIDLPGRHRPAGFPPRTMAALMFAVFTVSVGYGVVLPLLPDRIERLLGAGSEAARVARSVGWVTGIYMLAMFLFAPIWGRTSDRHGRRGVLLIGLVGFGAVMLILSSVETLWAVYAERFLSGMFAAAVTPVVAASIGDLAATEEARARRLTFVSLAGVSGFLLGPILGVFISRIAAQYFPTVRLVGSLSIPLAATAVLALVAALAVGFAVPGVAPGRNVKRNGAPSTLKTRAWVIPVLLALAFIVSAGVGVFEVGLALRGKLKLDLTPYQIAVMFAECSLVMFVAQAIVFSPWVKPQSTRWLIPPGLAVLAAGLFLVREASGFASMLIVVGAIAASAGILSPILTYWISRMAGNAQGVELGRQTAAASLGVAVGSVAGGLLFDVTQLPGASFLLTTGLATIGFILSLKLPHVLGARPIGTERRA